MYAGQDPQVGASHTSSAPATSLTTASQDYAQAYSGYPGTGDTYSYGNSNYQGYNYGYLQQQGNPSHSQHTGAYENSAAPNQAFENLNSYTDSTPYQGTSAYYNAAGYQNTATYQQTSYNGHSGQWTENSYYGNYSGYTAYAPPEASGNVNPQYPPDYHQQWAEYYASFQNGAQTDLEESPAPGTEPAASAIPEMDSQPPPPGTQPTWDFNTQGYSEAATTQAGTTVPSDNGGAIWGDTSLGGFQSDEYTQIPSNHFQHPPYLQQNLPEQPPHYQPLEDQHSLVQQVQHLQSVPNHLPGNSFQPKPLQSLNTESAQRRVSKLQIPTNPRIAPALGVTTKVMSMDSVQAQKPIQKPAYLSVAGKASTSSKVPSDVAADAMLKPGMFPPSLRAYVERALSRCKDEAQKKACQEIMKEMITSASSDGSLFTKDWDIEPLFPLPNVASTSGKEILHELNASNPLLKLDRRSKSRWEPVVEERLDQKVDMERLDANKDGTWNQIRGGETSVSSLKWDKQDGAWNKTKILLQQHFLNANKLQRVAKKARKDVAGESLDANNASGESEDDDTLGGVYLGTLGAVETPEEKIKRQSRTRRFDKSKEVNTGNKGLIKGKVGMGASASARRATAMLLAKSYGDGAGGAVEDINWDALTVKGTCQEIEKRYLRLTSAPDPSTVRPEEVLKKALAMVQTTQKNYFYKCEQLKSIRQDLTVQRIRNDFTVQVYETHARLALEEGDIPEYNQCQSQLKGLYAESISGCNYEFTAYNLLHIIVQHGNNRDLLSSMARIPREAKEHEAIKHALAVRAAVAADNYMSFFRLYRMAPNLGTCLMDLYVEKMRFEALRCMSRAYRPTLPVSFIGRILGFIGLGSETGSERDSDGYDECEEWLRAHGANLMNDNGSGEMCMDCKASASTLFMPEPEDAVAHGDANLAVNDFLAQA